MTTILCSLNRVTRYIQLVDMDFLGNFALIVKKQISYRTNLTFVVRFISQADIPEFTGSGVKILTVTATDADSGINSVLTYNLIVNPTGGFYIDPNTGKHAIRKIIMKSFTDKNIYYTWMITHKFLKNICKHVARF